MGFIHTFSLSVVFTFPMYLFSSPNALVAVVVDMSKAALLTIWVLYGFIIELLVFLEARDVSLRLQILRCMEDVVLRSFVGNHFIIIFKRRLYTSHYGKCVTLSRLLCKIGRQFYYSIGGWAVRPPQLQPQYTNCNSYSAS